MTSIRTSDLRIDLYEVRSDLDFTKFFKKSRSLLSLLGPNGTRWDQIEVTDGQKSTSPLGKAPDDLRSTKIEVHYNLSPRVTFLKFEHKMMREDQGEEEAHLNPKFGQITPTGIAPTPTVLGPRS